MDADRPSLHLGNDPPTAPACRDEVQRLIAFRDFAAAPQLRHFLEYIVEETLAHRGDQLKERNIAVHALRRDTDFDPRLDCVVRVMAVKLRRALESYYRGSEGAGAKVWIEVPRGAYRPVFRRIEPANQVSSSSRTPAPRLRAAARATTATAVAVNRPVVAILPLVPLTAGSKEVALSEALACELCVQLRRLLWLELLDYLVTRRWRSDPQESSTQELRCCDFMIGGTCRRQSEQLRVTAQLTSVGSGHVLWADQFDMLASVDNFAEEDAIVARICAAVSQSLQPAAAIDHRQATPPAKLALSRSESRPSSKGLR